MSQRKTIRKAVVDQLKGATAAGQAVFPSRIRPIWNEAVPAILVYSMNEAAQTIELGNGERQRKLTLSIQAMAKADEVVDDALDDLAEEIETAIKGDPTFGGKAADSELTETEMRLSKDGDQLFGLIRLNYEVTYYT